VDAGGGADFGDIASAIDEAATGDTISVAPGNYYGSLDFDGKTLEIASTDGPEATWIYASPGHPAVRAEHGEGKATLLEGFTITGGGGVDEPAISEEFSVLTLRNVTLTGNAGTEIVYARSALLTLDRVTIEADNTASTGWLVQGRRGMIVVKDSTVHCGTASVGYLMEHGAAFVDGGTFDCAGASAVAIVHSNGRMQRSVLDGRLYVENEGTDSEGTVVEGSVLLGGAVAYVSLLDLRNTVVQTGVSAQYAVVKLAASILTDSECAVSDTQSQVSVSYSDFYGNTANACGMGDPVGTSNNISADPLFVDPDNRDFQLQAGSPAIDAGPESSAFVDTDGTRNDLGAWGGPFTLAGGW
jgi:hypothetical protein